jgi:hypothetical protein
MPPAAWRFRYFRGLESRRDAQGAVGTAQRQVGRQSLDGVATRYCLRHVARELAQHAAAVRPLPRTKEPGSSPRKKIESRVIVTPRQQAR